MSNQPSAHLSVKSPLGDLTLFEDGGAIVSLEWGRAPNGTETPLLKRARRQLEDYFSGRRTAFDLPLAPEGTAFQKKVWREMAKIPFGRTRTYGALAKKIGTGPRAVGGACAHNPIPILLPCHRVLGANGGLGGYSGGNGPETKARMLALEAETTPKKRRQSNDSPAIIT